MSYREGEFVFEDEYAAYRHFISISSPSTWGTMTQEEWRKRPNSQMVSWSQWVEKHRPTPEHKEE